MRTTQSETQSKQLGPGSAPPPLWLTPPRHATPSHPRIRAQSGSTCLCGLTCESFSSLIWVLGLITLLVYFIKNEIYVRNNCPEGDPCGGWGDDYNSTCCTSSSTASSALTAFCVLYGFMLVGILCCSPTGTYLSRKSSPGAMEGYIRR